MTDSTSTDWRALCAELADSLEEWLSSNSIGGISLDDGTDAELIYRARAALAEPPSLKEQAIAALKHAPGPDYPNPITLLTADEHTLIRRALEQLPE